MARIVSLGAALQDIYLIDHDDLIAQRGKYYQLYTGQAELS